MKRRPTKPTRADGVRHRQDRRADRPYPLVLARLSRIDRDALHDLLSVSWRLTAEKIRTRRQA
jgi:hypothetical protein